ncbi:24019_t:CDS:1, partial [Gigaspora rosea]
SWHWGYRGLPCINLTDSQSFTVSFIILPTNSPPLSEYRINGGPYIKQNRKRKQEASSADFEITSSAAENLIKWSQICIIYLNSSSGIA